MSPSFRKSESSTVQLGEAVEIEEWQKRRGARKKVAGVAFKASRSINWDGMAKMLVSDEARKEFPTLRRAFDEVNSTLQTKFSWVCFLKITLLRIYNLNQFDICIL